VAQACLGSVDMSGFELAVLPISALRAEAPIQRSYASAPKAPRRPALATRAALVGVAVSTAFVHSLSRKVRQNHRGCSRRGTVLQRLATSKEDTLLANARAAAEVAKLDLQAAKLRAEAEALEREMAVARRQGRAKEILGEDLSEVPSSMLPERLKAVSGLELTEDGVRRLVESCRPGQPDSPLRLQDLSSLEFEAALKQLVSEAQQLRIQKQREEDQLREAAKAQEIVEQLEYSEPNDDRSLGTRLLACLAYMLPLTDALQFGLLLPSMVPAFLPLFKLLAVPNALINAIPLGSLITFFLMSILSNMEELPLLLRFNLQQAILIDVALFIPSIIGSIGSFVSGGSGKIAPELGVLVFLCVLMTALYSALVTLYGNDPDGIPGISKAARKTIDRDRVPE